MEINQQFSLATLHAFLSRILNGSFEHSEYSFKEWCDFNWRKNMNADPQDERMRAALQIAADIECQWDLEVTNLFSGIAYDANRERELKLPSALYKQWLDQADAARISGPGLYEGDDECTVLYRPTGPRELELVRTSGFKAWPPRLPEQPIFYPVTNEAYAVQIAKEWNIKDSKIGYVTRFRVRNAFMDQFRVEKVGGKNHLEWWIPAERLEELNANIVGLIEVIGEYK